MLVRNECQTFSILGGEINLYSEETEYGRNTVAEMEGHFHYLGDEFPNVAAAVFAWQEVNGRELTTDEISQIMFDNNLITETLVEIELDLDDLTELGE